MPDTRSCFEILGDIERLSGVLHQGAPPPLPPDRLIGKLRATVIQLSQPKKARPVKCPANYVALWREIENSRPIELPARAIRYLSWETEIAIQPNFQSLALTPERVNARSLQGLVRSVHRRWESMANTPSVGILRTALLNYSKKNALIEKWKQNFGYVLNSDGPTRFAKDILNTGRSWDTLCDEWGVEADSEFGNQVLLQCISHAVGAMQNAQYQKATVELVLPSKHWHPSSFKQAVQQMIFASKSSLQHAEPLKNFILSDSRLLDPRLPSNTPNWLGLNESARDLVIQWLSAEDIRLFFDHVLTTRNDPHGRKPFWLKYIGRVKRSRPLLASFDESRWLANVETRDKRNFGRMDYHSDTSAFLLDFGPVVVVEFSKVGNAVYVHDRRKVAHLNDSFWSEGRFYLSTLKQKSRIEAISHLPHWERKMRTLLAQYGILPEAK
ncbi:EH signature domain-containing protein [Occallatibacter savannae]|uniref:EH signature domain-containing protein n=1 Tax=Occallatibacter savannae TaxID=1002691 RepID=UPI000D686927|nr:EH signature domain-containing protein [Occallatibacter savannae]